MASIYSEVDRGLVDEVINYLNIPKKEIAQKIGISATALSNALAGSNDKRLTEIIDWLIENYGDSENVNVLELRKIRTTEPAESRLASEIERINDNIVDITKEINELRSRIESLEHQKVNFETTLKLTAILQQLVEKLELVSSSNKDT